MDQASQDHRAARQRALAAPSGNKPKLRIHPGKTYEQVMWIRERPQRIRLRILRWLSICAIFSFALRM